MDPIAIGFLSSTLSVVPFVLKNITDPGLLQDFINAYILHIWSESDTAETRRRKVIAKLRTYLFQSSFPGVWHQWELIDKSILPGNDQTVEQFRLSYISDCNMTAVAGVIIAQVAITSLSLPQIRQTHWAVRAFFITSLISGCFAVYFACWSQKTIGTLFKASDLKNWLTRRDSVPLSGWAIRANLRALAELKKLADRIKTGTIVEGIGDIEKGQFHELVRLQNESIRCHEWQRSASLWSAFLLQVPFTYMKLSLGSFVIGLTIYLGSVWTRNLDQEAGKNDSRNIFIVLLIVVVACIYFYVAPALYKSLEVLPIRSWMDCQEQLKEVAESLGRFVPKDKQHSLQSDPGSKASGKRKNAPEIPAAGTDEISILTNPAPKNPLDEMPVASSAGDTDIAQLSAALKAATSAQMSNNLAIQNLVTEIANLTGAMRDQERHPSLSRNPA